MKKKFIYLFFTTVILILPLSFKAAEVGRLYFVEINYDKGKVSFGEVSTKTGYAPEPEKKEMTSPSKYWIEVISFKGEILEKRMFSIPLEIVPPPPLPGEEKKTVEHIILEKTKHLAILPYYKNGKTLKLYDTNMNLFDEKDIGFLADVCGDDICEDHESYKECPIDCSVAGKDDYCNKEKFNEDPDCKKVQKEAGEVCNNNGQCTGEENYKNCPKDCAKTKISNKIIVLSILSIVIIIVMILVYYFLIRRKEKIGET